MNEANFAGILLQKDGRILLVQEKHKEAYGLWSVPLGHVEDGESFEQTAIRETKEETGISVEIIGLAGELLIPGSEFKSLESFNDKSIRLKVFKAKIVSGELLANPEEQLGAGWFTKDEISKMPLRGAWLNDLWR